MKYLKFILVLLLGLYGFWGAFHPSSFCFLRGVDTLFHEAGHPIFGVFGQWPGVWGGTVMQLLIPAVLAGYFLKEGRKFSAAVMLFWMAENLFGISIYIRDARAQVLDYIGGDTHDWGYILSHARWLKYDGQLADGVWWTGFLLLAASVAAGLWYSDVFRGRNEKTAACPEF